MPTPTPDIPLTPASRAPGPTPTLRPNGWFRFLFRKSVRPIGRGIASLITLRTRLLWVLLLAFVPAFALIVRDHLQWEQIDHQEAADEAQLNARLAAGGYERLLEGTRQVLLALTHLEQLRSSSAAEADALLKNFLPRYPTFLNIGVIRRNGFLFASARPFKPPIDLGERAYFRTALAQNDFGVGEFQIGTVTGRPSLNCAYPIRGGRGAVERVVFAALDVHWLNSMAGEIPIPSDARLLLLDRKGAVLAAAPPSAAKIGEPYTHFEWLRWETENGPTATPRQARSFEVDDRLIASSPIVQPDGSGLRVVYEISRHAAYQKSHFRLFINLGLLTLSAMLVLLLGHGAGHLFITRHVTALLAATRRLAQGDTDVRTGVANAPGELGQLADSIDHLARSLQRRDEELNAVHADLERQVAERTQELRASNEQLEAFSYSVSHDSRAPLRAIDGFSQILLNEHAVGLTPEGKRLLGVVVKNTNQMSQLIENLLTFARLGRQEPRSMFIDMTALARETFDEARAGDRDRRARVNIGALPPAQGDPAMIQQVLLNLAANAFKFSGNTAHPAIDVEGRADGAHNTYWVKDNGVGFDPKYAHRLFQVFQRLHATSEFEGTGVGLAIVQRIVQKHGGRVWAESVPGEGARFSFTLPAGSAEAHP